VPLFRPRAVHTILDDEEGDIDLGHSAANSWAKPPPASTLDALQDLVTIAQLEKGVVRMRRQRFDLRRWRSKPFELEQQAARRAPH
jgi:two-component system phosphate regulon sensor histidine kinase PhoR